jgi:ribonuclease P protein component
MIGRLVHKIDFERALATTPRSRSTHFAVHHVHGGPALVKRASQEPAEPELSTGDEQKLSASVDNLLVGHWLGCVIPKRHARRSVTRNLLRRQIRTAMFLHESLLAPGLWLVRLRVPFAPQAFVSAASPRLRNAARDELAQLFSRAARLPC